MAIGKRSDRAFRIIRWLQALTGRAPAGADSRGYIAAAETSRREALCRQIIGIAAARYFIKQLRTPDVSIAFDLAESDSDPAWIPEILARTALTEPEFEIFGFFRNREETILDVGAAYGYGAASIWTAGAATSILSFEPNPWHLACLNRIKELRPGMYDFVSVGLGATETRQRFVTPVVEGKGISGLSSAAIESEMDWTIPENVLRHMIDRLTDVSRPRLHFAETEWEVARLDHILRTGEFSFPLRRIAAVKIDVEGYEADVIAGGTATLVQHRPLLLVEGANRVPAVVNQLTAVGYRYAEFLAGRVFLSDEISTRVGGFWLHESRLEAYREMRLLCPKPHAS